MDVADLQVRARDIAKLLREMSNPHRLMILHHLAEKERCVGELVDLVGISQSALSQHLARLRKANLVATRRSKQMVYYSLQGAIPATLLQALERVFSEKTD